VLERYDAARTARERRAAAVAADLLLWTRVAGVARPGVEGRVTIAAPETARLVVNGAFGVALDLAARGDTLEGWVPSRHRAFTLDTTDTGGGLAPGAAACRALGGLWQPPGTAWDAAVAVGDAWVVHWNERGDSLWMTVTADGRPRRVEWRPSRGDTLGVSYESWSALDGEPWPDRLTFDETRGAVTVRVRLERIRLVSPSWARLRAAIPEGTPRSSMEDLASWWDDMLSGPR